MKIYTKTGDDGTTLLFGGGRVPKYHLRIETYGTVDELNSYIGLVRDQSIRPTHQQILQTIQNRLFDVGAHLATNPDKQDRVKQPLLLPADVELLEQTIDQLNDELPPLKHFILPGGHTTVSFCHLARCVCRRAERLTVALAAEEPVESLVVMYLNRLSDYLFVLCLGCRIVGHGNHLASAVRKQSVVVGCRL